jgi:hypothetical protein
LGGDLHRINRDFSYQTTRDLMLIDYILESGSEMILLGVDYYPEELLPAVDTERSVFDDVVNPHPTLLSDILFSIVYWQYAALHATY